MTEYEDKFLFSLDSVAEEDISGTDWYLRQPHLKQPLEEMRKLFLPRRPAIPFTVVNEPMEIERLLPIATTTPFAAFLQAAPGEKRLARFRVNSILTNWLEKSHLSSGTATASSLIIPASEQHAVRGCGILLASYLTPIGFKLPEHITLEQCVQELNDIAEQKKGLPFGTYLELVESHEQIQEVASMIIEDLLSSSPDKWEPPQFSSHTAEPKQPEVINLRVDEVGAPITSLLERLRAMRFALPRRETERKRVCGYLTLMLRTKGEPKLNLEPEILKRAGALLGPLGPEYVRWLLSVKLRNDFRLIEKTLYLNRGTKDMIAGINYQDFDGLHREARGYIDKLDAGEQLEETEKTMKKFHLKLDPAARKGQTKRVVLPKYWLEFLQFARLMPQFAACYDALHKTS